MNIPISDSITMRPVWRRRQLRLHLGDLYPKWPTEAELHDAILVLADDSNQIYAPDLYLEAEMIMGIYG